MSTRVATRTGALEQQHHSLLILGWARLGNYGLRLACDLHVLDHQVHCWSAWACQNWPPASSRCLQKPMSPGGCKPLGALESRHCQPPSIWSCGTHTWKRKRWWLRKIVTQSLEEHFQSSPSPATLPHTLQALICSQGGMCFIATSYLLNESQITSEPLVQTLFLIKTTFTVIFPVKLCHMCLLNSLTLSEPE